MANTASLKPFKKGDPRAVAAGKKSKRPPSIATALKKLLQEDDKLTPELLAKACIKHALDGSPAHMKLAMEYIDGKVTDKVEMTGADGGAMEIVKLDPKKYAAEREKMMKKDDV
jgi:hypothetical protein